MTPIETMDKMFYDSLGGGIDFRGENHGDPQFDS
jgi:hypothetical protein